VSVIDLTVTAAADRWPVFTAAVADSMAFRSVHALPLRLRGEAIGALNLFHRRPGPLPPVDLSLGQALADVATIGFLSERAVRHSEIVNEQLQSALNSRVIIEQAKGVLTQRGNLSMDAAFDRLRSYGPQPQPASERGRPPDRRDRYRRRRPRHAGGPDATAQVTTSRPREGHHNISQERLVEPRLRRSRLLRCVSVTNSTAFSPTATMPLSPRGATHGQRIVSALFTSVLCW
jgi:ANTAR domain